MGARQLGWNVLRQGKGQSELPSPLQLPSLFFDFAPIFKMHPYKIIKITTLLLIWYVQV